MRIITNNQARFTIDGGRFTAEERKEFDYLDWTAIDAGEGSATFFRYKGSLHDLGEFSSDYGMVKNFGLPMHLHKWDGYRSDSFFSALVVRMVDGFESVVVGLVLS